MIFHATLLQRVSYHVTRYGGCIYIFITPGATLCTWHIESRELICPSPEYTGYILD